MDVVRVDPQKLAGIRLDLASRRQQPGATALDGGEQALLLELLQGCADRHPAYPHHGGELAFPRQTLARRETAVADELQQLVCDAVGHAFPRNLAKARIRAIG